jgi:hypothetical protein
MKTILVLMVAVMVCGVSFGQDHEHDSPTGRWYEKWMMPDHGRLMSCCNNQDCAAVDEVRRVDGRLQMRRKLDGMWLTIPPEKLESNWDDARDSPDGFSHMCSRGETVYCAVLGSGI